MPFSLPSIEKSLFSLQWEFQLVWSMTCLNPLTWTIWFIYQNWDLILTCLFNQYLCGELLDLVNINCLHSFLFTDWPCKAISGNLVMLLTVTSIFYIVTVVRNLHWPMANIRQSRSWQIVHVCLSQVQPCKVLIIMDMPGIITVLLCLAMCMAVEDWWIVDEMKNVFAVLQLPSCWYTLLL